MRARYVVLGLLVLLSVITYLDRVCISVAGPQIREELAISPDRWGWVLGAFVLAYGLFEIPTGALGDRHGQRAVLTRIVIWWSAFTALTAAAPGFVALLVIRFLFGVGEAGAYPNASGSINRWFPVAERARAQGLVWGASRIGGALAPILVVPLLIGVGWRGMFVLFGAVGMLWAIVWYAWYRDHPTQHRSVTREELAEIGTVGPPVGHAAVPWGRLFRSRQLWLIMLMYWFYVWGSMFYLTWFPEYLLKGRGLGTDELAVLAALPFAMGAAGNLLGGFLSDHLSRKYGLQVGRRLIGTLCLAVSAALLLATALTPDKYAAVALLAVGFGVMDCMLPCAWALCLDVGGRYAGAVTGAMNSAGQAGGFVCSVLFGYLVTWYGNYDIPLVVIAGMVFVSAALFSRLDPTRPLLAPEPEPELAVAKGV